MSRRNSADGAFEKCETPDGKGSIGQATAHEEEASYRRCLSSFPTGVAILTARRDDGSAYGVTINSLVSISLRPRLVGWALQHDRTATEFFSACRHFRVHILQRGQVSEAKRFAGPVADRSNIESFPLDSVGAPIVDGAFAHLCCEIDRTIELGDHRLFVAKVLSHAGVPPGAVLPEPLIYFASQLGWTAARGGS